MRFRQGENIEPGRRTVRRVALAVLVLWGVSAPARGADYGYTTVFESGFAGNRVNIVFLGDGYTADQIETDYLDHIDRVLMHMFEDDEEPFQRYRNFFNAYRINLVSAESGADVPPEGIYRDTALDAGYYWDGQTERLLYVNEFKANQVLNAVLGEAPFTADMKLVTVNSERYGGGGGGYAVFAGGNNKAPELTLHELGHAFSDLADEYGDYDGGTDVYQGLEPTQVNVTKDASGEKWARWIGYDQPGLGVIGVYEGAKYYNYGLYRPSETSKMRQLGYPFNAPSIEKIILDIYTRVRPLDDYLCNTGLLTDPDLLWIQTVAPDIFRIEWSVDGEWVELADGESLHLSDYGFGQGDYVVSARAVDSTDWVRIESLKLEQTVQWQVAVTEYLSPGDANADGKVGIGDLCIMASNWGSQSGMIWKTCDFTGDQAVSLGDLCVLAGHWGHGTDSWPISVPEPCGCWVLGLALLGGKSQRRRLGRSVPDRLEPALR